jgi:hypothetical protein
MADEARIDLEKGRITETSEDGLGSDLAQGALSLGSSATAAPPNIDHSNGTKSSTIWTRKTS